MSRGIRFWFRSAGLVRIFFGTCSTAMCKKATSIKKTIKALCSPPCKVIRQDDVVTIDPEKATMNGSSMVVENGSEATFKQLVLDGSSLFLKPLNERYPIMNMTGVAFKIIGVVVAKGKRY